MTKHEGVGVQTLLKLADAAFKTMPETEARSFVDGLTDDELARMAIAMSRSGVASGETPHLVMESMAARLLGVDVETFTSKPGATEGVRVVETCGHQWATMEGQNFCVRAPGHEGPHSIFADESDAREH